MSYHDRPKVTTACDSCRKRKLRCDGKTPSCSNCSLYEANCHYAAGRNKSGPPKGSKRRKPGDPVQSGKRRSSAPSISPPTLSPPAQTSPPSTSDVSSVTLGSGSATPSHVDLGVSSPIILPDLIPQSVSENTPRDHIGVPEMSLDPAYAGNLQLRRVHAPTAQVVTSRFDSMDVLLRNDTAALNASFSPDIITGMPYTSPPSVYCDDYLAARVNTISVQEFTQRLSPARLNAYRCTHALVPLFSFPQLLNHIVDCTSRAAAHPQSILFINALESLVLVMTSTTPLSIANPPSCYITAQRESMPTYLATISASTVSVEDWTLTAAGLAYLAVREVLVVGWGKQAVTWLRLAIDIIESIPGDTEGRRATRRWFSRTMWLWCKALRGCVCSGQPAFQHTGPDMSEMQQVRDITPIVTMQLDDAQSEFSALVGLCLDLEHLMSSAEYLQVEALLYATAGQQTNEATYADIAGMLTPLCDRVNAWAQSRPIVQEYVLQFSREGTATPAVGDTYVKEVTGCVLQLIYFGMALKFDYTDRARCTMRRSTLYVAVTRLVDAADWLVSSGRMWLWSFAEPALLLARDYLLDRIGHEIGPDSSLADSTQALRPDYASFTTSQCNPASTGELSLLALIRDVFHSASRAMELNSPRNQVATQAVKLISSVMLGPLAES